MLKSPNGGLRIGGVNYPSGAALPEKYRRVLDVSMRPSDPARGMSDSPPNMGRMIVPQTITFSGMSTSLSKAYRYSDEAMRHSIENAHMMLNDPVIAGPLLARQYMVSLLNWSIASEDDKDPQLKDITAELQAIIKRTPRFTEYRRALLEAVWYGRYGCQNAIGFHTDRRGIRRRVVRKWMPLSGDKLVFRYDDGRGEFDPDQVGIRVSPALGGLDAIAGQRQLEATGDGMAYFLEPWERRQLVIHKHMIRDGEYEDPISGGQVHGVGLRHFLYWVWWQKQEALAQVAEIIDRTGMGFTIYYYPSGNNAAREEMAQISREQAHTNTILMPSDPANETRIEQLPPNTAGLQVLHDLIESFFGDMIVRFILGQTLSTKPDATGMNSGVADLQKDTLYNICRYDAVNLEETITNELLLPLRDMNFPKFRNVDFYFRISTKVAAPEQELQALQQLWQMGAQIKVADIFDRLDLSMPDRDDKTLFNPAIVSQIDQYDQQKQAQASGQMPPGMPPGTPGAPGQPPGQPPLPGQGPPSMGPPAPQQGPPQAPPDQQPPAAPPQEPTAQEPVEQAAKDSDQDSEERKRLFGPILNKKRSTSNATNTSQITHARVSSLEAHQGQVPNNNGCGVQELRWSRNNDLRGMEERLYEIPQPHGLSTNATSHNRENQQQRELRTDELLLGTTGRSVRKSTEDSEIYSTQYDSHNTSVVENSEHSRPDSLVKDQFRKVSKRGIHSKESADSNSDDQLQRSSEDHSSMGEASRDISASTAIQNQCWMDHSESIQYSKLTYAERVANAVAHTDTNPSAEQRKAGNYRKGRAWLHGLEVVIETPQGIQRRPAWKPLAAHYGYLRRIYDETKQKVTTVGDGNDGDHIDVFVGPHPDSHLVFIIDQLKENGKFDEWKVILGCNDDTEAKKLYLDCYPNGWKMGEMTPVTIWDLKELLITGNRGKQAAKHKYSKGTPQRYARDPSEWIPYVGKNGGHGWQSIKTGEIDYDWQPGTPSSPSEQSPAAGQIPAQGGMAAKPAMPALPAIAASAPGDKPVTPQQQPSWQSQPMESQAQVAPPVVSKDHPAAPAPQQPTAPEKPQEQPPAAEQQAPEKPAAPDKQPAPPTSPSDESKSFIDKLKGEYQNIRGGNYPPSPFMKHGQQLPPTGTEEQFAQHGGGHMNRWLEKQGLGDSGEWMISPHDKSKEWKDRLHLNMHQSTEGIKQLHDFVTKKGGYFKVPNSDSDWKSRADTAVAYFPDNLSESDLSEISQKMSPYLRGNFNQKQLVGKEVSPGIASVKEPTSEDVKALIDNAQDPHLKSALTQYFTHPQSGRLAPSAGNFEAAKRVVDSESKPDSESQPSPAEQPSKQPAAPSLPPHAQDQLDKHYQDAEKRGITDEILRLAGHGGSLADVSMRVMRSKQTGLFNKFKEATDMTRAVLAKHGQLTPQDQDGLQKWAASLPAPKPPAPAPQEAPKQDAPKPEPIAPAEKPAAEPAKPEAQAPAVAPPQEKPVAPKPAAPPAQKPSPWKKIDGPGGMPVWQHEQTGVKVAGAKSPDVVAAEIAAQKPAPAVEPQPSKPTADELHPPTTPKTEMGDTIQSPEAPNPEPPTEHPIDSYKSAGPANQPTSRQWTAGMNRGSTEFANDMHRDLFDIHAKRKSAMTADKSPAQQKQLTEQANQLASRIAAHTGVHPSVVNDTAQQVHEHARQHMQGIKDGEHRPIPMPSVMSRFTPQSELNKPPTTGTPTANYPSQPEPKVPSESSSPASPPQSGVPVMITNKMKDDLLNKGLSREEISKMTPQQAWDHLKQPSALPENWHQKLPPVKPGHIRLYHGGDAPQPGETRWVTPDPKYAEGYATKGGDASNVHYVDIPETHPSLVPISDVSGTNQKPSYSSFDADPDIAAKLRPVSADISAQSSTTTPTQPTSGQTGSGTGGPPAPKIYKPNKAHIAAAEALPEGSQLFGWTKRYNDTVGGSFWEKGRTALPTSDLLKQHQDQSHLDTLNHLAQHGTTGQTSPPPGPASGTTGAGPTPRDSRPFHSSEMPHVSAAAAIFGIAPGNVQNHREVRNFLLRTARNIGFDPSTVQGDRTDQAAAAASYLYQHKPALDAVTQMAKAYGWGGGSARELAHSARFAGLHLVNEAAKRGWTPDGNTEQERMANAIGFLKQHEATQPPAGNNLHAITQILGQMFAMPQKWTPAHIALAVARFYVGYKLMRHVTSRRRRRYYW